MHPPNHSRDFQLRYSDPVLTFTQGPWEYHTPHYLTHQIRSRYLGRLEVTAHTKTFSATHIYMILQKEERRRGGGTTSFYENTILLGNLVDEDHEEAIFHSRNSTRREGLWCTKCWCSCQIPKWMLGGRYYGYLRFLPGTCDCGLQFEPFRVGEPRQPGHSYLFSSVQSSKLQEIVEAEVIARYGFGTTHRERKGSTSMDRIMYEELIAEAMHPRRLEALIARHGLEAAVESF